MIAETLLDLARPIADLKLDPANARLHNERNLEAIKASLKRFGQQKAIVALADGTVIAGNGTLEAAKALGWNEIAVSIFNGTAAEAKAYALADNRTAELATWDQEQLAKDLAWLTEQGLDQPMDIDVSLLESTGFNADEIADILPKPHDNKDPDEIPEQVEPRCKTGQLWILGNHRLLCGDSTKREDVERLMNGEKADMVFTDPPYGVSYTEKNEFLNGLGTGNRLTKPIQNDHMSPDKMNEFWFEMLTNAHFASSDYASYYICSPQGGDLMMMMMISITRANWMLKHMLIWVKNNHVLGRCDYNYKHEPILFGWKNGKSHHFFGNGNCKTSVWNFDKPYKSKLHPTMKPVALCEEAIQNSSDGKGLILDLFLGSGSTLIACEKTNRRCFGMEIEPHYCDVIIERWEQFSGKKAVLHGE